MQKRTAGSRGSGLEGLNGQGAVRWDGWDGWRHTRHRDSAERGQKHVWDRPWQRRSRQRRKRKVRKENPEACCRRWQETSFRKVGVIDNWTERISNMRAKGTLLDLAIGSRWPKSSSEEARRQGPAVPMNWEPSTGSSLRRSGWERMLEMEDN